MSLVEKAVEGLGEEAEDDRCISSTPLSSFQLIQSRLIRPFPLAITADHLQDYQSSSQQHINRSMEVVNLEEEAREELDQKDDDSCNFTPRSSSVLIEQRLVRFSGVADVPDPIFQPSQYSPQHMNEFCNDYFAANKLEEDAIGSSSAPSSCFPFIQQRCLIRSSPPTCTQPALLNLHYSRQRRSSEHKISQFSVHDRMCKTARTLNVVQKLEEETAPDEITSTSTPVSLSQLIQSRHIKEGSPSCTSEPTINLHRTDQSSALHHLATLSVYKDCSKHEQSVRDHLCRRRLFSKSMNSDEAGATLLEPIAANRARIEDYVDVFLLSEVAQKISHKQDMVHDNVDSNLTRGSSSFDWPSAELQAMTTSTPIDCYPFITEKQLVKDDDLQIKQYPGLWRKSRRGLFQDMNNQNQIHIMKDMNSQFNQCGWSIRSYHHDHDCTYRNHHPTSIANSSVAQNDADFEGVTSSPSTPQVNFQSFDTTVRLFQT